MAIRRVEKIDDLVKIKNVVISVSDKEGLEKFVIDLVEVNPEIKIYSSGGTYAKICSVLGKDSKNIEEAAKYTLMPETKGGLVKTLHHKLFLGYLTETYCEEHQRDLRRENDYKLIE